MIIASGLPNKRYLRSNGYSMSSLSRDLELLYEIGSLRWVQRQWKQFLNPDFANLSEHTLRVVWLALLIAQREGVEDTGKVVKMALVHDLSESRSVDVHYLSRQYVERNEASAVRDSLADTSLEAEFLALSEEYEQRESLEAKIVKDADNLEVDLELKEQEYRGFKLPADFAPMRQHVGSTKLFTKTAQKLWREIQESNPNQWHLSGRNRFQAGDWQKKSK